MTSQSPHHQQQITHKDTQWSSTQRWGIANPKRSSLDQSETKNSWYSPKKPFLSNSHPRTINVKSIRPNGISMPMNRTCWKPKKPSRVENDSTPKIDTSSVFSTKVLNDGIEKSRLIPQNERLTEPNDAFQRLTRKSRHKLTPTQWPFYESTTRKNTKNLSPRALNYEEPKRMSHETVEPQEVNWKQCRRYHLDGYRQRERVASSRHLES